MSPVKGKFSGMATVQPVDKRLSVEGSGSSKHSRSLYGEYTLMEEREKLCQALRVTRGLEVPVGYHGRVFVEIKE